ncbi:MAG: aminotransferase class V-fold PLP-dependent enzyme [Planctomycetota bacterium]|jgi:dTDP-4-amino-4,6-dideoxygalactose transaminase|nr:aminotransferase class V-fold PLP-dependent enzyme [Planctomycetota bacterium]MDP7251290.1 aminotransferase class V-fold PLP-dependent enzyme [Planctomycetota bacterium]
MKSDTPAILGGTPLGPVEDYPWPPATDAIREAIERVYKSGDWGRYHGNECQGLKNELCEYLGLEHVELCCSGTAAVELALRGAKVGEGDEVILSAYDFKGNFTDVLAVGGTPVLVDPSAGNWNLDPARLVEAVSDKTTAILVSHLHGGIVPMKAVMDFADEHSLVVIEDAAQMPGAVVSGRQAGTWGHVGVFSFGGSKLLSAGRGGTVFTNDSGIAQRIHLHCHRGNHAYPLSELQAAVVRPQLSALDSMNEVRAKTVEALSDRVSDFDGLSIFENQVSDISPGYYKVGFKFRGEHLVGLSRQQFSDAMRSEGVALSPGFRSLHRIHSKRRFRAVGELSNADEADDQVMVLSHPGLLAGNTFVDHFIRALARVQENAARIRAESGN